MNLLQLKARARTLWAWLLARWLYVIAACVATYLIVGAFGVVKTQETKEAAVVAVEQGQLSKKQVRVLTKEKNKLQDSIRHEAVVIRQVRQVRDSAVVAAKQHEAKADSLIKTTAHENDLSALTDTDEWVEGELANYRPRGHAVGTDTIR